MAEDQPHGLEDMKPSLNNSNKFTNELTFNGSSNSVKPSKPDASNKNLVLEIDQKGSILYKPSELEVGLENLGTSSEFSVFNLGKTDRPVKFDVGIQNHDGKGEFSGLKLEKNNAILHKPSKFEVGSETLGDSIEDSGLELNKKGVHSDKLSKHDVGINNLDGESENSALGLESKGGVFDKPSKCDVDIENNDTRSDLSGLELEKNGVGCDKPSKFNVGVENNDTRSDFSGLESEKNGVVCDKPSKLEVGVENLDGKGKFSGVELDKRVVGDVGITDSCNKFEVGLEKKEISKVGEVCLTKDCSNKSGKCSVKLQVVDETALVDVVEIDHKKNKRKGKKGNVNLNGGKKRCVYTRKKLESLRFVNVKGQKKFWKEVYDGFTQAVKEEYDELGCFRHHKQGQRQPKGALMSNLNGHVPVGMPAGTKRWNYYNIFVY